MSTTTVETPSAFSSILESNNQSLREIKTYRDTKVTGTPRNLAFAGMALGAGLLFIIFAAQIITGMLALVLTGVTIAGGFFGLRALKTLDPLIRQKTKNFKMEQMVKEAQERAIYQLDNQVITNSQRLDNARQARDKMGAMVAQLRSSIKPENKGKPLYEKKVAMLAKVENAYDLMCANLEAGAKENKLFQEKVNEHREMHKFASLAGEAMAIFSKDGDKELENMLSLEAFSHISGNFDTAIISIENSAKDMQLDGGYV